MNLSYSTRDNGTEVALAVRANKGYADEIKEILQETAALALEEMLRDVPRHKIPDSSNQSAYHRTIAESLDFSNISYRPGGAGGGGSYSISVGAANPPEHLQWIFDGTDRYPAVGNMGKLMVFEKMGEGTRFIRSRKGQKPQVSWFLKAYRAADAYLYARLQSFDVDI